MKKNLNASNKNVIIISGPTAVGKTELSLQLAKRLNGQIVSADSMQIYRGLAIGTAAPTPEEQHAVPHHLVQCIAADLPYSVADYARDARSVIKSLLTQGITPIVSGGTGLYINSLIYQMDFAEKAADPQIRAHIESLLQRYGAAHLHRLLREMDSAAAARIHPNNTRKVGRALEVLLSGGQLRDFKRELTPHQDYEVSLFVINRARQQLYDRINRRVDQMINAGLVDEVAALRAAGVTAQHQAMKGIGYAEINAYLNGEWTIDEAVEAIKKHTRHYAKRQVTWFKRYSFANWLRINTNTHTQTVINYIIDAI